VSNMNHPIDNDKEVVKVKTTTTSFFVRHARVLFAALWVLGATVPAHAGGTVTGTVGAITVLGSGSGAPGGLDFRVNLMGNPEFCNGYTWGYVNVTDANYGTIVASILSARTSGATINIVWIVGSTGYCQISSVEW
jgi:hypothetical protein